MAIKLLTMAFCQVLGLSNVTSHTLVISSETDLCLQMSVRPYVQKLHLGENAIFLVPIKIEV